MQLDPVKRQAIRDENAKKLNTLTENYTGTNLAAAALNFKDVGIKLRKDNMYGNEERQRYNTLKPDYTHHNSAGLVHEMEVGNSRLMMVDAGYSEIGENSTKERYRQEPTVLRVTPAEGVSQEFFDKGMDFIKTASKSTYSAPWNSILFAHKRTDMNNAVWQEVMNLAKKPEYANHPFVKAMAKLPAGANTKFVNVENLGGWRENKDIHYTPEYIASLDMLYDDIKKVNTPDAKGDKEILHPGKHSAEGKAPIIGTKKLARSLQEITTPAKFDAYGNKRSEEKTEKEPKTLYATASQNVRRKEREDAAAEAAKSAAEQKGKETKKAIKKPVLDDYIEQLAYARGIKYRDEKGNVIPGVRSVLENIANQAYSYGLLSKEKTEQHQDITNKVKQIVGDEHGGLSNVTYKTLMNEGLVIRMPSNLDQKVRFNTDEMTFTEHEHGQDLEEAKGGKKMSSGRSLEMGQLLDERGKEIEAENAKRAKYYDENSTSPAAHQVYQTIGGELSRRQDVAKYFTNAMKVISGDKEIQTTIFKRSLADFSGTTNDEKKDMLIEGIMSAVRAIGTYDKSKGTSMNSRVYTKVTQDTGEIKHNKRVMVKSLPTYLTEDKKDDKGVVIQHAVQSKDWNKAYEMANKLASDMMKEDKKVKLANEFSKGGTK